MELPLFPLHTVLCPGIALPLHIFEERYREMARHCLDTTSPFGVVLIREGREVGGGTLSFAGVGTIAEIRKAGRYPDGRYDLLVVGTGRFAIEAVDVERGAVPRRRGHAARRRGRRPGRGASGWRTSRPAGSSATSSCSSRARASRPRRSTSASRSRPRTPTPRPTEGHRRRSARSRSSRATRPSAAARSSSPTTRRCCRTCWRGSSRSSCRGARRCSRPRRPTSGCGTCSS